MKFDYDGLHTLAAVIKSGSFDTAARTLNVTQSAVSQRIKQLEQKFGAMLVVRGRPCRGTLEGAILCQHLEEVGVLEAETLDRLRAQIASDNGDRRVTARISVNADSLATWFPEVLRAANDQLSMSLEVIPDDQEFTDERLRSGEALAIVTSSDAHIPGCQSTFLGEMEYMAVASPEFAEQYFSDPVEPSQLMSAPSVLFDRKDTLPLQWMKQAFSADFMSLQSHLVPSYEGLLQSALRSVGWVMMPSITVGPLIEAGQLVELVPGERLSSPLFWQSRANSRKALMRLTELVHEVSSKVLINADEPAAQLEGAG